MFQKAPTSQGRYTLGVSLTDMKIKIVLTIVLIICLFWAGLHFAEKKQKDIKDGWELKEKYKNNHDSIFLSDITLKYKDKRLTNIDSFPKIKLPDNSAYLLINLYDNTSWTVEFPSEEITFEAYQKEDELSDKFIKSKIHTIENSVVYKGRREWDRYITIFNKDTLSNINNIQTYFYNGLVQKIKIMFKKANP